MAPLRQHLYRNVDGSVFARKEKYGHQQYQWLRCQDGKFISGLSSKAPIYHADQVALHANIVLNEGERDADTLAEFGLCTSCGPNGASWDDEWADNFRGKTVVICPDLDAKGQEYALHAGRSLLQVAASVQILDLPTEFNGRPIKDITDLYEAAGDEFSDAWQELLDLARPFADFQEAGQNGDSEEKPNEVFATPIFEYIGLHIPEEDTILGNRFLCRHGGMLFIGPSGMGKSSASIQMDMLWSMGRPAFGIRPSRPLKILTAQAEDDQGDVVEMATGVARYLNLTPEEISTYAGNCHYRAMKTKTGQPFIDWLHEMLKKFLPDLLRINPLQAYIGGDPKDTEKTVKFLRNGLNPLLEEFNCGVIVVHHTPKTNFRSTEEWKASDWMYAGAGSADITNWGRAILIADPTDTPRTFRWIAAKRGARIGWADENGDPCIERYFKHSGTGNIHWEDADEPPKKEQVRSESGAFETLFTPEMILERMQLGKYYETKDVQKDCVENIGLTRITFFRKWKQLKDDGKIQETEQGWIRLV
jgi:hypothetical protein